MNEIIRPTDELPVSVLKANHIVFDELSFVRDGFSLKDDSKTSFNLSYGIDKRIHQRLPLVFQAHVQLAKPQQPEPNESVSYTHLRAHET